MYLAKTPRILRWPYPELTWNIPGEEPTAYLTFDDGPIPEVTEWVLDQLKEYKVKGTFFIVAENAVKHPQILQRILDEGHSVGNHTYNHLNGWKTGDLAYLDNIEKAQEVYSSTLFRPPYGKIKKSQIAQLKPAFKIIMWDILSGDFDEGISGEQCAQNVVQNLDNGSIIVFHDSLKAWPRLKIALPMVLEELFYKNYKLEKLS